MTTLILRRAATFGQWWREMGFNRVGFDLDLRMWLVSVPAVAVAVTSVPAVQVSLAHPLLNVVWRFLAMFGMATVCSLVVTALVRRGASRGRSSDALLACWWVGAGAAVWMNAGWTGAIAGGAGAGVLLHLMVRHLSAVNIDS